MKTKDQINKHRYWQQLQRKRGNLLEIKTVSSKFLHFLFLNWLFWFVFLIVCIFLKIVKSEPFFAIWIKLKCLLSISNYFINWSKWMVDFGFGIFLFLENKKAHFWQISIHSIGIEKFGIEFCDFKHLSKFFAYEINSICDLF